MEVFIGKENEELTEVSVLVKQTLLVRVQINLQNCWKFYFKKIHKIVYYFLSGSIKHYGKKMGQGVKCPRLLSYYHGFASH